jgi:hypothetical protein
LKAGIRDVYARIYEGYGDALARIVFAAEPHEQPLEYGVS